MDHNQHDSKMMWGMMLACAVPILLTSLGSAGRKNPIVWAVLGLGLMVLLHWVVMRRLHRGKKPEHAPGMASEKTDDKPQDGNTPSCH